jgi:2'-5' RNA ligase
LAQKVRDFGKSIPDEYIYYDKKDEKGRQEEIHVTVKYGIHTDDPAAVLSVVENVKPLKVRLGKTKIFWLDNCIVLKISVQSQDLVALNRRIRRNLQCTDTYPDYKPHITIAYVKLSDRNPYWFQEYLTDEFDGMEVVLDELVFSTPDKQKYKMLLMDGKLEDRFSKIAGNVVEEVYTEREGPRIAETNMNPTRELLQIAKNVIAGDEWMDEKTYAFTKEVAKVMQRDKQVDVVRVNKNRIDFIHSPDFLTSVKLVLTMMEFGYLGAGDGSDEDEPTYESVNGSIFSEEVSTFRIPGGFTKKRDPVEFWKNARESLDDIIRRARA